MRLRARRSAAAGATGAWRSNLSRHGVAKESSVPLAVDTNLNRRQDSAMAAATRSLPVCDSKNFKCRARRSDSNLRLGQPAGGPGSIA